ncbi:MAG: hypothetical protein Q8Q73_14725 [Stagnimonas sp.]|nr:hypothetical protein [Stagnimonas sp.]
MSDRHQCTIAKSLGSFRAVLYRNGAPVHHGTWRDTRREAEADRESFIAKPFVVAPAFLPGPAIRKPVAVSAAQLSMFLAGVKS